MEQKLVEIRNSCLKYYKSVISDFSENIFEFDNFVKIEAHLLQILIPKLEASEDIFYHESEFFLRLSEYYLIYLYSNFKIFNEIEYSSDYNWVLKKNNGEYAYPSGFITEYIDDLISKFCYNELDINDKRPHILSFIRASLFAKTHSFVSNKIELNYFNIYSILFYLNLIEYDELINKGADHYQDDLAEVQEFFEKTIEKSEIVDVLDFSKMNPNNPENLVYRGLQTFRIVDEAFFIEKLKSYGKTLIDTH